MVKTDPIRQAFLVEKRESGERRDGFLRIGPPIEEKPGMYACEVEISPVGERTRIFGPSQAYALQITLDFANLRLEALRQDFRFVDADGKEITTFSADIPSV